MKLSIDITYPFSIEENEIILKPEDTTLINFTIVDFNEDESFKKFINLPDPCDADLFVLENPVEYWRLYKGELFICCTLPQFKEILKNNYYFKIYE